MTKLWLDAQKATPSFLSTMAEVADILDAPLPAGLRDPTLVSNRHKHSPGASRTPNHAATIHEELIMKGRLYQQKREALQERGRPRGAEDTPSNT